MPQYLLGIITGLLLYACGQIDLTTLLVGLIIIGALTLIYWYWIGALK